MSEEVMAYGKEMPMIDGKTIQDYLFSTQTKLSEPQKHMFMQLAIRNQLDPFRREIHAIPYGNDFNIVTGYQVYIQRAEATGKLDGWECMSLTNEKHQLIGARITIYRKDFAHPFIWEVALAEFDKGHSNWKKMPEFMIKKVCIGQGFRLAFPNELGGMPYLAEELEGLHPNEGGKDQESEKPPIQPPQAKSMKDPGTHPQAKATGEVISEAQRKRFYAIAKTTGATDDQIKDWLFREYGIEHTKDITRDLYDEVCARVKEELGDMREPGSDDA